MPMQPDGTLLVLEEYTDDERYRVYAVAGNRRDVLATAPDPGGVGQALVALNDDEKARGRRLVDLGKIGVYDALEHEWIVMPWHRGGGD